jgi:hypothetical protein
MADDSAALEPLYREFPQLRGLSLPEAEAVVAADPELRDRLYQFTAQQQDRIDAAARRQAEIRDRASRTYAAIMGRPPARGLLD